MLDVSGILHAWCIPLALPQLRKEGGIVSYITLQESVNRIVRDCYSEGDVFSTLDVYDKCRHREATKSGIAHALHCCGMVVNINPDLRTVRVWRRI